MFAKIYRPSKTAMQSGRAKTRRWVLEFEPRHAKRPDPLMGWASTTDMQRQVTLRFDTKDEAVEYARKHGIAFRVRDSRERQAPRKAYASNFAYDRKEPWSH